MQNEKVGAERTSSNARSRLPYALSNFADRSSKTLAPLRSLSLQLLRSETSIGANVEEAQAGQSKADFVSKLAIALKEARETGYWLRLIRESGTTNTDSLGLLEKEALELAKILGAIISKARKTSRT